MAWYTRLASLAKPLGGALVSALFEPAYYAFTNTDVAKSWGYADHDPQLTKAIAEGDNTTKYLKYASWGLAAVAAVGAGAAAVALAPAGLVIGGVAVSATVLAIGAGVLASEVTKFAVDNDLTKSVVNGAIEKTGNLFAGNTADVRTMSAASLQPIPPAYSDVIPATTYQSALDTPYRQVAVASIDDGADLAQNMNAQYAAVDGQGGAQSDNGEIPQAQEAVARDPDSAAAPRSSQSGSGWRINAPRGGSDPVQAAQSPKADVKPNSNTIAL
jgi:hypothetical protein